MRATQVMRFLISKNANVDARDSAGRTVLSMAAESNQRDSLHLLLEAGCTVNVQSHTGFTGECRAIQYDSEILVQPAHEYCH